MPPSALGNLLDDDIITCYKKHRIATRLTIKPANRIRYNTFGSALLQMLIRKPRDALKSITKTASTDKKQQQHAAQQISHPFETLSQEESLATPHKSKE
jgi:hypothetical protein